MGCDRYKICNEKYSFIKDINFSIQMVRINKGLQAFIHPTLIVALSLVTAIGLKWIILINERVPFNSDEAIVALMARHILSGDRPIFFYGQSYMGSLDAWLVSFGFLLFGESVWVIRFIQTILYCGTILTTYWLGRIIFKSSIIGSLGALLLAVPTVNVLLYTTVSLGGYSEALLIGNLILICAVYLRRYTENNYRKRLWLWATLGFLGGVGFWSFGITLIYFLPALVYSLYRHYHFYRSKELPQNIVIKAIFGCIFVGIIGFIIGSLPLLFYGHQSGWLNLIREYTGGAIARVEGVAYPYQIGLHILNFLVLGISVILGFRPPWASYWLAMPLIPFQLLFWIAVGWFTVSDIRNRGNNLRAEKMLLLAPIIILFAVFIFSPFGADPSGRYFIPVIMPMSLFAAGMIIYAQKKNALLGTGLLLLVMGYHLWGFIQITYKDSNGFTTQFDSVTQVDQAYMGDLINFLEANGELRGYTNYWVSYPLAFLSSERVIFIPRLPYHGDFRYSERDDRYSPYYDLVADADKIAYITSNHERLDMHLREEFQRLDIKWREVTIGDFRVFYDLSAVVRPADIGLGTTT